MVRRCLLRSKSKIQVHTSFHLHLALILAAYPASWMMCACLRTRVRGGEHKNSPMPKTKQQISFAYAIVCFIHARLLRNSLV